jgi:hypothetical protein
VTHGLLGELIIAFCRTTVSLLQRPKLRIFNAMSKRVAPAPRLEKLYYHGMRIDKSAFDLLVTDTWEKFFYP